MNVISISLDRNIFNILGRSFRRQLEYSRRVNKLVVIVYTSKGQHSPITSGKLIIIPSDSTSKPAFVFDAVKSASQTIRKLRFTGKDTIITTQDPIITGIVGFFLKLKFGFGLNIQDHSEFYASKYWRRESLINFPLLWIGRLIVKNADTLRTVSAREYAYWKTKNYPEKDLYNVPIYYDLPPLKIKVRKRSGSEILYCGRFEKEKNIPMLIRSVSRLVDMYPDLKLTLLGSGSQNNHYQKLIKSLKLENYVSTVHWTDEVQRYYRNAQIFVLCSNYEGWGMTVVEAANAGCAVVMTNTGCAGSLVINDYNGWVIPIGDENALTAALKEALEYPKKRVLYANRLERNLKNLPDRKKSVGLVIRSWEAALNENNYAK